MARTVAGTALLVALHGRLHLACKLGAVWQGALSVARVSTAVAPALLVARPDGLELIALILEQTPRLRAGSMASVVIATCPVAILHLHHVTLDELVEVPTVIALMLLVAVAPPALMASLVFGGRAITVATVAQQAPHLGAGVVARVIPMLALLVARGHLLQRVALFANLGERTGARVVALAAARAAFVVALHCLPHLACQLGALRQGALGVASMTATLKPALHVARPYRLELLALLLEGLPRLRTLLVTGVASAAHPVADLHRHHFLAHGLVEGLHMIILVFLILVAPPTTVPNLIVNLCDVRSPVQVLLELVYEPGRDLTDNIDRTLVEFCLGG